MPAAVMYKGRAERPRRTGTAWVAVPTRRSADIGATPVGGITLSDGEDQGERAPSRRSGAGNGPVGVVAMPRPNGVFCAGPAVPARVTGGVGLA